MSAIKKTVGIDDVIRALKIRESGGSWGQVIEATGFNGATLRPHITEYLQREVLKAPAVNKGDRTDSPYAIVQPVELTQASIDHARAKGMAWYSIAKALNTSEAKVKGLASPESKQRVYAGVKGGNKETNGSKPEPTPEPKAESAKERKNRLARERRAAKKQANNA
jgi:hypothetical protein